MKIIFHCISSENPFAKDRVAAEQANRMLTAAARQIEVPNVTEKQTHDLYKKGNDAKLAEKLQTHQSDEFHVLVPCGKDDQECMLSLFGLDDHKIDPKSIPLNLLIVYRSDWCLFPFEAMKPEYRIPTASLFNITDKQANPAITFARETASVDIKLGNLMANLMIPPEGPKTNFIQYDQLRNNAKAMLDRPSIEERESTTIENKNEWAKAALKLPDVINERIKAYEQSLTAVSTLQSEPRM